MKNLSVLAIPLLSLGLVLSSCASNAAKVKDYIQNNKDGTISEIAYDYVGVSNSPLVIFGYSESQQYDHMNYLYYTEDNIVLEVGSFYDWGSFSEGSHAIMITANNGSATVVPGNFKIENHKMKEFSLVIAESDFVSSANDTIYNLAMTGFTYLSNAIETFLSEKGLPELY